MQQIKYNKIQIIELKENIYVKNVTEKHIVFTKEFKVEVLKLSSKWMFYREIFNKLWFPDYIVNSPIPESCYTRWKNNLKTWSIEWIKWRPKKEKLDFNNMTLEEENSYLKAKIAYLEEVEKLVKQWLP